jgi:hypothetical protein
MEWLKQADGSEIADPREGIHCRIVQDATGSWCALVRVIFKNSERRAMRDRYKWIGANREDMKAGPKVTTQKPTAIAWCNELAADTSLPPEAPRV